jgi:hypothetical protein
MQEVLHDEPAPEDPEAGAPSQSQQEPPRQASPARVGVRRRRVSFADEPVVIGGVGPEGRRKGWAVGEAGREKLVRRDAPERRWKTPERMSPRAY